MKVDNYQIWAIDLFNGACYAACISYLQGGKDDPIAITRDILNGVENDFIEPSGYVSKPHLFANMCMGKEHFYYTDVRIKPYKEEPFDQIVCWKWNDKTHFVVMRSGKIVFDPWPDSNTVKNGKPTTVREFI
jgi:hypothetical protein